MTILRIQRYLVVDHRGLVDFQWELLQKAVSIIVYLTAALISCILPAYIKEMWLRHSFDV
jgi:hypothetical protein